jgi:hypothetical protein
MYILPRLNKALCVRAWHITEALKEEKFRKEPRPIPKDDNH